MINTFALKRIRRKRKVTQAELCEVLDITGKTFSQKENGSAFFNHPEMYSLAKHLKLSMNEVNEIFFENSLTNAVNI